MLPRLIRFLVTDGAPESGLTSAVRTALDVKRMRMAIVALQRPVANRMAVHTSRMHEDRIRRKKRGPGAVVVFLVNRSGDAGLSSAQVVNALGPIEPPIELKDRRKQQASDNDQFHNSRHLVLQMERPLSITILISRVFSVDGHEFRNLRSIHKSPARFRWPRVQPSLRMI
jgi:hypothetical protein